MTVHMIPDLWCDKPRCGARLAADNEKNATELRARAREVGWRRLTDERSYLIDVCPNHTADES